MQTQSNGGLDSMEFWISPSRHPDTPAALIHPDGSVELFVEELDSFCITDADLPNIRAAILAAQSDGAQAAAPHPA